MSVFQFFDMPATTVPKILTSVQETSGAGAAVAITVVGVGGYRHYLASCFWSYSAAPTAGALTIAGLNGEDLAMDITAAGPGPMGFPPVAGAVGTDLVVTLAGGGGAVVGKLTIFYATLPAVYTYQGATIAKSIARNLMPS